MPSYTPCTPVHRVHPEQRMLGYDATAAVTQPMCTSWCQSGVSCLTRGVISETEDLKIALVTITLLGKQPLCARQTGFCSLEHKTIPDPKSGTPGFQQLI